MKKRLGFFCGDATKVKPAVECEGREAYEFVEHIMSFDTEANCGRMSSVH